MVPRMTLAMALVGSGLMAGTLPARGNGVEVSEPDDATRLVTPTLEASIRKRSDITGIAGGTFLDVRSGFRDAASRLDVVDRIMEPRSDEAYRAQLDNDLPYDPGHSRLEVAKDGRSLKRPGP